jgi:zinc transporter ZupT
MFHTFSVHKSVDALKVLATGVVSSLLAVIGALIAVFVWNLLTRRSTT